jgi:cell division transport system permease protein
MFLQRTSYFTRKALSNIGAYPLVTVLVTVTIAAVVFIFCAYVLFLVNLTRVLSGVGEKVHITAYLSDAVTSAATDEIRIRILSIKEVEAVSYVSKDDALAYLKESFQEQADLLDNLAENPLPASFEVTLREGFRSPDDVKLVADKIERIHGVDDVDYAREWLSRFYEFFRFVKAAGLGAAIILLFAAVAIIANTLKLIVLSRRQEIEIMKLVGATNAFIKTPIVLEGMIVGLVGSTAALVGLAFLFGYFMEHYWQGMSLLFGAEKFVFFPPEVIAVVVLGGVFIGTLGSLFSFGRLLKV